MPRKKRNKIKDAHYENHYVYSTHYHVIWCTQYRNCIFDNQELAQEMKNILLTVAKNNRIAVENIEIMPEHVHMLISFRPSNSGSSVMKALKGRSAKLFFEAHPEIKQAKCWGGHLWSGSYYFGSVGNMSKETINKYISDQVYNAQKEGKPCPSPH